MKINKKYTLILLMLLTILMLYSQSIIYAAINSKVSITGDAIARIKSNVRINSFKIHEVSDGVISSYEDFSKTYTMSNVTLPYSDSYIIYELVIGNYEDVEMQLSNITGFPSNLTYELIDYNFHDMICDNTGKCFDGVEKTFYLKIKYENYNASGTNYNINLEYEFKEFSNKLMIGTSFRDTIPSNATHLVFTDEKPTDGIALTDVSAEQDMGVVGYLDGTTYKVSTRRTGVMPQANVDSSYMFNSSSLTNIDLDNLDISLTKNMIGMFQDCVNLLSINFGDNWETTNVTQMKYMFKNCSSLTSIDLSGFKTSNVISFSNFFNGCKSLTSLDLSKLDTSKSTSFSNMFRDCQSLDTIDVSKFNASNVTSMADMFSGCIGITSIDVSNFSITKSCVIYNMFSGCSNLETVNANNLVNNNVTKINGLFNGNKSLVNLNIDNWDTSNVTSIHAVFGNCNKLTSLDLSSWQVENVIDATWMFESCISMTSLNLSGWKFIASVSLNGMFHGMQNLENLNIDNWNTSGVKSIASIFVNCYALKTIDLSSWNTSNITVMQRAFHNLYYLEKIYVGDDWDTSNVSDSVDMFYNCHKLINFDSNYLDATKAYVGDGGYLSYPEIEFTIQGTSYQAEKGMTWREWYESDYCTNKEKYSIVSNYVCLYDLSFNPLTGWTSLEACDEEGNSYHSHVDQEIVSIDYIL